MNPKNQTSRSEEKKMEKKEEKIVRELKEGFSPLKAKKLEDQDVFISFSHKNVDEIKFTALLSLTHEEYEKFYRDTKNKYLDELCDKIGEELESRWGTEIQSELPEWIGKEEYENSVDVYFSFYLTL